MHGRSPKGVRNRGGLDVEAAGKQAEVQKEQESVSDWTLKLREACGSPKGARKRDGLDVEAAGGMAEVQKEQEIVVDWTLKLRDAWQKSKRSKKPWWIGR